MSDQTNGVNLSKAAVLALILSFLTLLPGLGLLLLPVVAILIVISFILLKRHPALTGGHYLIASAIACIVGICINFFIISNPEIMLKLYQQTAVKSFTQNPRPLTKESIQELLKTARKMEGGDGLIRESTLSDGTVDGRKLFRLITEIQIKQIEQAKREINEMTEKRKRGQEFLELAREYEDRGKYELAIEQLNQEITLFPDESPTYAGRARVYEKLGENERALVDISHALDLLEKEDADDTRRLQSEEDKESIRTRRVANRASRVHLFQERGDLYRKLNKFDLAEEDYSRAIYLSEKPYAWLYFVRGLTYRKRGELDKAKQDLNMALSLGLKPGELREDALSADGKYVIWYYPNGNIRIEGNYKDGKKAGLFKWYREDGTLQEEHRYKEDIPVS